MSADRDSFPIGKLLWCGALDVVVSGPPDELGLIPTNYGNFAPHALSTAPPASTMSEREVIARAAATSYLRNNYPDLAATLEDLAIEAPGSTWA